MYPYLLLAFLAGSVVGWETKSFWVEVQIAREQKKIDKQKDVIRDNYNDQGVGYEQDKGSNKVDHEKVKADLGKAAAAKRTPRVPYDDRLLDKLDAAFTGKPSR